ncbi:MAG: Glu-tRNA(Gln) amidotransferase subunit GatD [archaeon]
MKDNSSKALAGDKVRVKYSSEFIEGTILESYDKDNILVKLDSGYNIGLKKENIESIKVLAKAKKQKEEIEFNENKKVPHIGMIVTGGTISSKLDYETGGVKWLMKPEEILSFAPKLFDIARISSIEKPFMLASENMTSNDWKILAKKSAELLNKPENKGIIITHGTDTLHYTAAALSFMLKNIGKPVVLSYSQRSTDRGSSDTALNLTCSAHAALSGIAEIMLVGHGTINDNFCLAIRGTKVRKMHTSRRDTFRPINELPFAKIHENGSIEIINENFSKRNESKKTEVDAVFEDKTALIKYHPNANPEILEFLMKKGYKGIIIEATGLGHVATEESKNNWLPSIKECIKAGMTICFAPQTIYGKLDAYVYAPGRELLKAGVIFLEDMLPETAYVKLGYVLGHKNWQNNQEKIKEMMLTNIAGEFNRKISTDTFLY